MVDRLAKFHPDHQAIARGMVLVVLFVFFGKLAGAAKEVAIAWRYGVSEEVDAYLLVLNLVSWPVGVWFSVLTVVLVHGAFADASSWNGVIERLQREGHTVVAPANPQVLMGRG